MKIKPLLIIILIIASSLTFSVSSDDEEAKAKKEAEKLLKRARVDIAEGLNVNPYSISINLNRTKEFNITSNHTPIEFVHEGKTKTLIVSDEEYDKRLR